MTANNTDENNDKGFDKEYIDEAYNDVWGTQNPNFNRNNYSSGGIELKQSPEVKSSELIKNAFYYPDRNRAKISLNGKVNADIVFTPDTVDWQRNIKMVMEQAQAYGYKDIEHKSIFYRFLNDNENILTNTNKNGDIGDNGDNSRGNNTTTTAAENIVKLVMENIKLFKNEFEEPYVLLVIDNHYETLS